MTGSAGPWFMGEEVEWAILIQERNGNYRLPYYQEFRTMINGLRSVLRHPEVKKEGWLHTHENINASSIGDPAFWDEHSRLCSIKNGERFSRNRTFLWDHGILPSGFRFYVDADHLELSSPGCSTVKDLIISAKAGDRMMNMAGKILEKTRKQYGIKVEIFKDTSNRKGTSFAGHENYLINRRIFNELMNGRDKAMQLASFFALRIPLTGAGKTGSDNFMPRVSFQISQRADWIERIRQLGTVVRRPLINMRDEPHARCVMTDGREISVARLHVICGEPNMSPRSMLMRFGFTYNFLTGLQGGVFNEIRKDIILADPVQAIKIISRDLYCKKTVELADGRRVKFFEILRAINDRMRWYFSNVKEPTREQMEIIGKVEFYCDCFEKGSPYYLERLITELDWVNRFDIYKAMLERNMSGGARLSSGELVEERAYWHDLNFADINPDTGLFYKREKIFQEEGLVEALDERLIADRVFNPPSDNRSFLMGEILKRFPEDAVANWSLVEFSDGSRLWLSDPFRGSRREIGSLVRDAESLGVLLEKLKGLGFKIYKPENREEGGDSECQKEKRIPRHASTGNGLDPMMRKIRF